MTFEALLIIHFHGLFKGLIFDTVFLISHINITWLCGASPSEDEPDSTEEHEEDDDPDSDSEAEQSSLSDSDPEDSWSWSMGSSL